MQAGSKPMKIFLSFFRSARALTLVAALQFVWLATDAVAAEHRLLYVAEPGIRDYQEYGGHGVLVFDIDAGHKFVRRIGGGGVEANGHVMAVKGICASAATQRLYVSTTNTLECIDLLTDKLLWEKAYEGGCDRMAISPDGKLIYLPAFEGDHWQLVDAATGDVLKKFTLNSGSHNTVYGLDGAHAYLAGLKSKVLTVVDARTREVSLSVGPFGQVVRPLTVNGSQTLCFVNVNDLLGFEVGDLKTGKVLQRVEVTGFKKGPVKRHGCPAHGIALNPDETELWLADGFNRRIHIFDATVMPPKQIQSIELRDEPGWITFSIDGSLVYPSTGEVIDAKTRKVVATLKDETGREVQSEKLLEIDFADQKAVRAGDQFGLGQKK